MNAISMLEDYKAMFNAAAKIGKFEAYRAYTSHYPTLFESVLKYLYQCPLEALQDYIESADFLGLLSQGEENKNNGLFQMTKDFVNECSVKIGIDFPFDLYLGMELGNIGGASLPTADDSRFVYIGMDKQIDEDFLRILVPHELHHLLRIHNTGEKESTTLRTRMISEGMASYCPLWYYDLPWNIDTVSKSLGVKQEQGRFMLDHAEHLVKELWDEGDVPLNQTIMEKYFTTRGDNGDIAIPGYFVGMWLIYQLVSAGRDFLKLTNTSTSELLRMMHEEGLL